METRVKVLAIQGSPHKDGMTARLVHRALAGAQTEGAEVRLLDLVDEDLRPCRACGGDCFATLRCVQDSAATERTAALQDADGVIFGVPVYCWQINSLSSLFIDKMRWDTGSVLEPRNRRVAFGVASAGGSGTGCVLALQALYRWFYNWAFHGITPLPVSRFSFEEALGLAQQGGRAMVRSIREGTAPFPTLAHAMAHYQSLPYMSWGPVEELRMIITSMRRELARCNAPEAAEFLSRAEAAEGGESDLGDVSSVYDLGVRAWQAAHSAGRGPRSSSAD
jgi:multimeric flavodoxin WrbA